MPALTSLALVIALGALMAAEPAPAQELWPLARRNAGVHRFSTLFTAQDVREFLSNDKGIAAAIDWLKQSGVTKVYLETYRSGYQADLETLVRARDRFQTAGFRVSGCVAPSRIGKISTGWNMISCFTNQGTQTELRSIFEYAAQIFDEIIVDGFWYTDCTGGECDSARKERQVKIRTKTYPVAADTWEAYRAELMLQLSRSHVIGAARRVNPNAKVILKFPHWYDQYHERGYDVLRETAEFDRIWVGAEIQDRSRRNEQVQYHAYFLMRWLGGIGGARTGGAWYDSLQTTEKTYVEQARQTILGGARESILFSYGELQRNFGPEDTAALRHHLPELLEVAAEVRKRKPLGIGAYKPPGSSPEDEAYVYDYVGMLGLPLVPRHRFPADSKAVFLPIHAWSDASIIEAIGDYIETGSPVLITDGLARRLSGKVVFGRQNVQVLKLNGKPESVLGMPRRQLEELRTQLLEPFGITLKAPADVALYLYDDRSWVIENFSNREVTIELNHNQMIVGAREWVYAWR